MNPERSVCSPSARPGRLASLGPLPERTPMGHGARGLRPGGTAWEYFPMIMRAAAPIAGARMASPAFPMPNSGCACRWRCGTERSDSEGAPVRLDQRPGQSRRGRQGAIFLLDATPSHSYLKMLYKYPQQAFPYAELVAENARRGTHLPEYELLDTGMFSGDRYFDVFVEYAQAEPGDILMKITVWNRGPERPSASHSATGVAQYLELGAGLASRVACPRRWRDRHRAGRARGSRLYVEAPADCCSRRTNPTRRGSGTSAAAGYFKDGIHERIVEAVATA